MSFAPYLTFTGGTCRAAMTFYAEVFGATDLQLMAFSEMPPEAGPTGINPAYIMHSQFSAGPGAPLLASDTPEGWPSPGSNLTVFHAAADVDRAAVIFNALATGGSITMPLAPTFWAPTFGMLTDKFGTAWMITVAPAA